MTRPALYELNTVRKVNSDSFELNIKSLSIFSSETLCLLGPTGAGKSTLLRLLSGLEAPTSGSVEMGGRTLEASNAPVDVLRHIAMVYQRPLLLSESVRYNVGYGLKVRGEKSDGSRLSAILDALGLSALVNQDARTLSGGQAQLVALARALVFEPRILLLDEPTAHLDPASVERVENRVRDQQARTGMTIVWATHNLFQARRMACRVGLLLNGQLVEIADKQTFFENPTEKATADFVQGRMVY